MNVNREYVEKYYQLVLVSLRGIKAPHPCQLRPPPVALSDTQEGHETWLIKSPLWVNITMIIISAVIEVIKFIR
jgi:hypothetical protein